MFHHFRSAARAQFDDCTAVGEHRPQLVVLRRHQIALRLHHLKESDIPTPNLLFSASSCCCAQARATWTLAQSRPSSHLDGGIIDVARDSAPWRSCTVDSGSAEFSTARPSIGGAGTEVVAVFARIQVGRRCGKSC